MEASLSSKELSLWPCRFESYFLHQMKQEEENDKVEGESPITICDGCPYEDGCYDLCTYSY